jgi:hypothetical protein
MDHPVLYKGVKVNRFLAPLSTDICWFAFGKQVIGIAIGRI